MSFLYNAVKMERNESSPLPDPIGKLAPLHSLRCHNFIFTLAFSETEMKMRVRREMKHMI